MAGTRIWSKAGWTNKSRHDAAYIETPDGLKFVLVIFTENHANEREVIPTIAGKIVDRLRARLQVANEQERDWRESQFSSIQL